MKIAPAPPWTNLQPVLSSKASRDAFVELARALSRLRMSEGVEDVLERFRKEFVADAKACRRADRQALLAAGLIIIDLVMQGWILRVRSDRVEISPPTPVSGDRAAEKARIRRQELVKRDAQLRQPSVQKFVDMMERPRLHKNRFVSIFSLMRDGRELAAALRRARALKNTEGGHPLTKIIDPYLDFVASEEARCAHTGLRLMDIWRYFRHTWANQYTSVPGRTMLFLVRDRAAENHPVIGIGALSSPIMQIRERDTWLGWHPDTFLTRIGAAPTRKIARWLVGIVDEALAEIYTADLLEDGVLSRRDLTSPSDSVISRLLGEAAEQRRLHHRFVRSRDLKRTHADSGNEYWAERARTHLFRSKRALALATYLRARAVLNAAFDGEPTAEKLAALAATGQGRDTIRRVLRKAKADRVGIALADISVCGAVQPYNALLGGKLVAMLAASPEVIHQYSRRYSRAESEIASSVAGRSIVRAPHLVFLGTTSLYGVGSSQYNRIKIPADRLGGAVNEFIHYKELGRSEAFGTSQYSEETLEAMVDLVQQSEAQRVNSIFGEGVSPKLRKVRQALDLLGLPSAELLCHHRPRIVYGVSMIRNLGDYLIGLEKKAQYIVPLNAGDEATAKIGAWWRERWLRNRIESDEVLEEVSRHTHVHPICHGARIMTQRVLSTGLGETT